MRYFSLPYKKKKKEKEKDRNAFRWYARNMKWRGEEDDQGEGDKERE